MFCFLQRWKIDRALDEDDALTSRTEAHVARCADCRRHHEQQRAVVNRLEQSAQLPVPEAPAFLRSRVMNALRDEESAPLPVRWGVAAWAPIAVVAAIAMVGILKTDPQPAPPRPTAPQSPRGQGPGEFARRGVAFDESASRAAKSAEPNRRALRPRAAKSPK